MKKVTISEVARRRTQEEANAQQRRRNGYIPFNKEEAQQQWSKKTLQRVNEAMVVYGD